MHLKLLHSIKVRDLEEASLSEKYLLYEKGRIELSTGRKEQILLTKEIQCPLQDSK